MIIKVLTTGISVRALGYKMPVAAASALMLAQIGEFSFVLERAGREVGLTPAGMDAAGSQTFIAATVVLMVVTPFLMRVGDRLSNKMTEKSEQNNLPDETDVQIPSHAVDLGRSRYCRRLRSGGAVSRSHFERFGHSVCHYDSESRRRERSRSGRSCRSCAATRQNLFCSNWSALIKRK